MGIYEEVEEQMRDIAKRQFMIDCAEHEKRLDEMEEILGELPHLRKELELLKSDPEEYARTYKLPAKPEGYEPVTR